jgi:hypothetical protein
MRSDYIKSVNRFFDLNNHSSEGEIPRILIADTVGRHGVLFLRKYTKFKFNFVLRDFLKYLYEYINEEKNTILKH